MMYEETTNNMEQFKKAENEYRIAKARYEKWLHILNDECEEKKSLVGRYFKYRASVDGNDSSIIEMWQYFKVTSSRGASDNDVSVAVFFEKPYVEMIELFDGYLAWDLIAIYGDSVHYKEFEKYEEISENEFYTALTNSMSKLEEVLQ